MEYEYGIKIFNTKKVLKVDDNKLHPLVTFLLFIFNSLVWLGIISLISLGFAISINLLLN